MFQEKNTPTVLTEVASQYTLQTMGKSSPGMARVEHKTQPTLLEFLSLKSLIQLGVISPEGSLKF